jgi:hypothetical protein
MTFQIHGFVQNEDTTPVSGAWGYDAVKNA